MNRPYEQYIGDINERYARYIGENVNIGEMWEVMNIYNDIIINNIINAWFKDLDIDMERPLSQQDGHDINDRKNRIFEDWITWEHNVGDFVEQEIISLLDDLPRVKNHYIYMISTMSDEIVDMIVNCSTSHMMK